MDELSRSYQILEIASPASEDEIKKAYRDLVKVWHPDRFVHDPELRLKAQEKLKEINGAYQVVLANLFAEGTTPKPGSTAAPDPPPQNPHHPGTRASSGTRRARWMALAAVALLSVAVAVFPPWKKSHAGGKQALISTAQPGSRATPAVPPPGGEAAIPVAPATDLRRGLILDFSFDNEPAGGKVKDESGHGNDGRAVGVKWVPGGRPGGGLEFGPGESYVRVPNNAGLNPSQFTLAAWIKTTQLGPIWRRIFDKGSWDKSGAEHGYDLTMGGDDKSTGRSWQGQVLLEVAARAAFSEDHLTDGKWHQVAGTFDGASLRLYVDGQVAGEARLTTPPAPTSYDLTVGHPCTDPSLEEDTAGFVGTMSNIRMYDRALSAQEMRDLFESQGGVIAE